MGKIKLTERNLGGVFNFRHLRMFATAKRTNLKWKAWSKQLLGSLPLAFAHPALAREFVVEVTASIRITVT